MTDHMFDKFVRDKLRDHPSPVPAGLWERIEEKKDREVRPFFFRIPARLWIAVLFIAAGVFTGYLLFTGSQDTRSTGQQPNTAGPRNNAVTFPTDNGSGQTRQPATGNGQGEGNPTTQNNQQNNSIQDIAPTASGTTQAGTKNTDGYHVAQNHRVVRFSNQQGRYGYRTGIGYSTGRQGKNDQTDNDLTLLYGYSFTPGQTASGRKHGYTQGTMQLNTDGLQLPGIDCPPNGRMRRNDWYLEIYGSPDLVQKTTTAETNPGYAAKKDSTETQQLSYTAGFRISKSIGENLLFKTGLQYSQINEKFELRTENERRIITVVTIRSVISAGGTDSTVRDTTSLTQIGYRLQRTYNRYRSIDIPLLISYEFGNENLKFAVNAGAIVNLYSWYSGNTLNDSLAVVSVGPKGSVYRQNIGIGLYAGFSVIKPLSGRTELFLEPYFRYNLSNMSVTPGLTQRFNAAGLSIGIRYRLSRQRPGTN
ncbi:MAG TPA: hypothetical protein VF145_07610 [Chitinophagaceae bacterium]